MAQPHVELEERLAINSPSAGAGRAEGQGRRELGSPGPGQVFRAHLGVAPLGLTAASPTGLWPHDASAATARETPDT